MPNLFRNAPIVLTLLLATTAACSRSDPYDETRMDLHPGPATLTTQRHTGEFAMGRSLSAAPDVPALDPAPVKTIQLDVVDSVISLAPGVRARVARRATIPKATSRIRTDGCQVWRNRRFDEAHGQIHMRKSA